ncbi:MAG: methyl-accepting chemotaxis protein, partial [Acidovorax sp.]|nr:methyl-accepting chemotaxis protein [Acidovorax sp.]
MRFKDLRVAHQLWGVILGLLVLMLAAAIGTQLYSQRMTEQTEALVQKRENAITTAVNWRGQAELALTMSMARFVTTDITLRGDFDKRVVALTARITPVQEKINETATSEADKAALAAVAAARADVRSLTEKIRPLMDAEASEKQQFLE